MPAFRLMCSPWGVTTKKSSSDMAYMVSLYSPNGTYDSTFLKNYADIYILDDLKRISGVGDVSTFGSDYSMRIWLDPDKLSNYGLTVSDVKSAIQEQNVQAPAGMVGQLPAPDNQEKQYTGRIEGRLSTPEEFGNIILKSGSGGSFVRLKDVARVETGAKTNSMISEVNGSPAVGFGVELTSDANAMQTIQKVKQVLAKASKNFPRDIEYKTIIDNTEYISESIKEVAKTFAEALLLVVLIVFIFLQNWRATLIPVLAIPVSLVGTFASFEILGFSINTLTLFAMVLAIGLVVDDAIVVIENVEKHMAEDHVGPKEATRSAMKEVQGPVVAIACVLASVFVPVAFLDGMTGVLYKQFALTIAVSMALSAFVALSLTPALCSLLLKQEDKQDYKGIPGKFFCWFNGWFDRMRDRYTGAAGWWISHARLALAFLLIVCGLTGICYHLLPSTFVPDEDQGYFLVSVHMPEGTSLNRRTDTMMNDIVSDIRKVDGVSAVMKASGYDITVSANKSNSGTCFVSLTPWSERMGRDQSVSSIVAKVNGIGRKHPDASVSAFTTPTLPGLGMVGGWTMELQDLSSHSDEELNEITQKIIAAAAKRPELSGVHTTYQITSPVYQYDLDRDKIKNYGVSLSDVFTAMQVNYGGYQVNDFNSFGRTYKVMLQADSRYRNDVDGLKFIFVKSASGSMVPLENLLKPKVTTAPSIISRFNGKRSVSIQGSTASGYSSGQALSAMEEVVRETAPDGFAVEWSGQSREEKNSSSSMSKVMVLALLFAFLCLAALYESWTIPYAVLLSVPSGIFGAFFTEYLLRIMERALGITNAGLQDSVYMQIGIIMIIGLAAKNAILIVEFAKVRTDAGMDVIEAALEAASMRLRPILMTSFAFIIGCLPLAAAGGAGAAARNSMGTAVVGGMIFATALGIFLVPAFFVVMEKLSTSLKRKGKKNMQKIGKQART